jgi:hypothetical protein
VSAPSNVHVLGICQFEIIAIRSFLTSMNIANKSLSLDKKNNKITDSDIVVLCLSSPIALGWVKYVSMLKSVYDAVVCKIIVLVPRHISPVLFADERVIFLCGKLPYKKLTTNLLEKIQRFNLNDRVLRQTGCGVFRYWVLEDLVTGLPAPTRALILKLNVKTILYHRLSTVKSLGFSTYHQMMIFLAGSDTRTIISLKKRLLYN